MNDRKLRFQTIPEFQLENGTLLRDVRQAYHLDGQLNEERDNLIVVFHALTGSADAAGDWWCDVVGPGKVLDTNRYAVLCTNLLGSCYGTTGLWAEDGDPLAPVTTRDMVRLIYQLVDELSVRMVALATGASLGGMMALEWAASYPRLTRSVVSFAAPAAHTATGIAWGHIQRRVIEAAGETEGLEIARMIAMMTYRTPDEFSARFGRALQPEGGYQVASYLDHHGRKLRARFDARSYRVLTEAMDSHDIGRARGGVAAALDAFEGRLIGVGISGDRLYSEADVQSWTRSSAEYREIESIHGHDAFLIEIEQVSSILDEALTGYGDLGSRTSDAG